MQITQNTIPTALTIRRLLRLKGYTIRKLAMELERSTTSVHRVIYGVSRSRYIEGRISEILETTPNLLWGYK